MHRLLPHAATRPLVRRTLHGSWLITARLAEPMTPQLFNPNFRTITNTNSGLSPTDTEPNINSPDNALLSKDSQPDLRGRLSTLLALDQWTLTSDRMGVYRKYTFKTFSSAWKFMTLVAQECKYQRHHPNWGNTYNEVWITWTTHEPLGLSSKDVDMAEFCDNTAAAIQANKSEKSAKRTS